MHEQAARYIANIATVVAQADGTTPEAAYARQSEERTEANPTQEHEEAGNSVVGQGASTAEAAGQNAEPATPVDSGIDSSLVPIPDSTNQLPKDSTPSASARGAGYNDPQAAGEEKAGGRGAAANTGVTNSIELFGAAANPRLVPYAINPNGVVRTPTEALDLARANGANIPKDFNIGFIKGWTRTDADAEYFYNPNSYKPTDLVDWEDFYHAGTGKIPVRINADLLNSDEALVAHVGHEMHELNALRDLFDEAGGSLQARQLNQLIAPREQGGLINNLHEQAWDAADALVWKMRNGGGS